MNNTIANGMLFVNDEEVGQVDAVVNTNIDKANMIVRIIRFFGNLFG